jgi:hypothetical protein
MVNVVTRQAMTPEDIMNARIKRVKEMSKIEDVMVEPSDGEGFTAQDMRELLEHPHAGKFRDEGPMLWPNDTYTFRRLKEGSVKLVEKTQKASASGRAEEKE